MSKGNVTCRFMSFAIPGECEGHDFLKYLSCPFLSCLHLGLQIRKPRIAQWSLANNLGCYIFCIIFVLLLLLSQDDFN